MAQGGPVRELCEEASCSVCLDFFRDPVTIAECGHNFCRACLARSWGEAAAQKASCPQCRGPAQEDSLRPNQQLANFVAIIQKLSPSGGKGSEGEGGVCEKHGEPLRWFCREDEAAVCVVCARSEEHRSHQVTPREVAAVPQKETVVAAKKKGVCQEHQEPLKLFCKDHEATICVVCEQSQEHRYHEIIPVEEAAPEYKDQFCSCVETLHKEKDKILAYKASIMKESQDLLRQTKGEQQKTVAKFKQLRTFLDKQEKLLPAQVEEVEKEVARERDKHLADICEELSSLESLIQEIEEKSQQPASDLLQDARSTLQRYEEKELFEYAADFSGSLKWRIWNVSALSPFLEGIKKQLKDTLDSGLYPQKANVTLDPDTAHRGLILSEDQKSVMMGENKQVLPDKPQRFKLYSAVLGHEEFRAGCHFWEVFVGSEEEWRLGVARKSVDRKNCIAFIPEVGFWAVEKTGGTYRAMTRNNDPLLTLTWELQRIRVCLNYTEGQVAFFDADRGALLYEFSGASFSGEILLPFFWVRSKGHLKIS